jgi:hypothetical protein
MFPVGLSSGMVSGALPLIVCAASVLHHAPYSSYHIGLVLGTVLMLKLTVYQVFFVVGGPYSIATIILIAYVGQPPTQSQSPTVEMTAIQQSLDHSDNEAITSQQPIYLDNKTPTSTTIDQKVVPQQSDCLDDKNSSSSTIDETSTSQQSDCLSDKNSSSSTIDGTSTSQQSDCLDNGNALPPSTIDQNITPQQPECSDDTSPTTSTKGIWMVMIHILRNPKPFDYIGAIILTCGTLSILISISLVVYNFGAHSYIFLKKRGVKHFGGAIPQC